ncbi:MAG: gamma carbonic anhydrase family protein, partial [Planctomycetaceae bacterium]
DWNSLVQPDLGHCPALPHTAEPIDWNAINSEPSIDSTAWIAASADVVGRVRIGARTSVWYQCVIRGDAQFIDIGEDTNIQDGSILHIDGDAACTIGNRVSLGHRALVHASVVEDDVLIGMSATVLSRCVIGRGAIIAAGAVVLEGTSVPEGTIWAGVPAKQISVVTSDHQRRIEHTWKHYANMAAAMRARDE